MTSPIQRYVRSHSDTVDAPIDGGCAVLNPRSGEVLQLNASGYWLWQRLSQPATLADLARDAGQVFDGSEDPAAQIETFLSELLAHDLLRRLD